MISRHPLASRHAPCLTPALYQKHPFTGFGDNGFSAIAIVPTRQHISWEAFMQGISTWSNQLIEVECGTLNMLRA